MRYSSPGRADTRGGPHGGETSRAQERAPASPADEREPATTDMEAPTSPGARPPLRMPVSTYRLQLNRTCTLSDARHLIAYFVQLGITDVYTSPYLAAGPGSPHGYDITNHNELNAELGTKDEYDAFVQTLAAHAMGHVLDFVPNHMGIDPGANAWWSDVLENGTCSPVARYFDIDWEPVKPELRGKVLLPILGDQYGQVLERGELRLRFVDGALAVHYFAQRLPINPSTVPLVLRHDLDALRRDLTDDHPEMREFLSILTALNNLATCLDPNPEQIAEHHRERLVARDRLARVVAESPRLGAHIDRAVAAFNGAPGRADSFDALHELLETQSYRLAYWKTASHEINYRRFFDINTLAALRMEDPEVFNATHQLVLRLIGEGRVAGLRIDHPDGLLDPAEYFGRLQQAVRRELVKRQPEQADALPLHDRPLYVVAEKILGAGEGLSESWPIHGTTGYDFLNEVNGLFIDPRGEKTLKRMYARFTGRTDPFDEVVYESKKLIMDTALASELTVLAQALDRLAEHSRRSRDFTLLSLRDALVEIIACLPVYRTYVSADGWTADDREVIARSIARARARNRSMETSIFDFIREVLLPQRDADADPADPYVFGPVDDAEYARRLHFSKRLQQYTAPVQAKGVEDTAFYRHNVLVSLNEVGGDADRFGRSVAEFHTACSRRRDHWPYAMLATATHDTKLGEDTRARIDVLSELADAWRGHVWRWARINAGNRANIDGQPAPDRNAEYRFYQALVGMWPADAAGVPVRRASPALVERMSAYMEKATKEAKVYTSWIADNRAYDRATAAFVEQTLAGPTARRFFDAFLPFQRRVAHAGAVNSLAQVLLRMTVPGVPDLYRGSELWDLTLVDPDNRQPVDFALRTRLLDSLASALPSAAPSATARQALVSELLDTWHDGRLKLYVMACVLQWRRAEADLFRHGDYLPLHVDVAVDGELVAFARRGDGRAVVTVAPRLTSRLVTVERPWPIGPESWKTSRVRLPPDLACPLTNVLTGEVCQPVMHGDGAWLFAGDVLRTCPVALLATHDAPIAADR